LIVQSDIKKVYYLADTKDDRTEVFKESIKGSKVMSAICGIELIEYKINDSIDFGEIQNLKINPKIQIFPKLDSNLIIKLNFKQLFLINTNII